MPSKCFLCKGNILGNIRFPTDDAKRSLWFNNLHLSEVPNTTSRICEFHFKDSDFIEGKRKRVLKGSAVPFLPAPPSPTHLTLSSVLREHSYSTSGTKRETLIINLIQVIFAAGVLFITLLTVLFYILEKEDVEHFFEDKTDQHTSLTRRKKKRGKFSHVAIGMIQSMYTYLKNYYYHYPFFR